MAHIAQRQLDWVANNLTLGRINLRNPILVRDGGIDGAPCIISTRKELHSSSIIVECGHDVLSAPSNTVTRPGFKTALDKNPSDRPFLFRPLHKHP